MKKVALAIGFLSISLFYTSCKKVQNVVVPEDLTKKEVKKETEVVSKDTLVGVPNCQPLVVDFLAGQHIDAGNIEVKADSLNLYVTFSTQGGWVMNETHLYVGTLAGMPQTPKGNPKIGNFPYKANHSPGVSSFTYTIPRSNFAGQDCVAIAAHSATSLLNDKGEVVQSETAWSAGKQLNQSGSWAMYTTYCFCNEGTEGNGGDDDTNGGIEGN